MFGAELAPLLQQIQVQTTPTVAAVFGGRMLDVKMGPLPAAELDAWIQKVAASIPDDPDNPAEPAADREQTPRELVMAGCATTCMH